jgi:hypothetical protein
MSYGTDINKRTCDPSRFLFQKAELLYPPDSYRDELRNHLPGAKLHYFSNDARKYIPLSPFKGGNQQSEILYFFLQ